MERTVRPEDLDWFELFGVRDASTRDEVPPLPAWMADEPPTSIEALAESWAATLDAHCAELAAEPTIDDERHAAELSLGAMLVAETPAGAQPVDIPPRDSLLREQALLATAHAAEVAARRAHAALLDAVTAAYDEAMHDPALHLVATPGRPLRPEDGGTRRMLERSIAADIGARLHRSEHAVRSMVRQRRVLDRLPRVRAAFERGDIPVDGCTAVTDLVQPIPAGDDDAVLDAAIVEPAMRLTAAALRPRLTAIRDRVLAASREERHRAARDARHVRVTPVADGMAWLEAYLPAEVALGAERRIRAMAAAIADSEARVGATPAGEARSGDAGADDADGAPRTLDQVRADVLGDLLLHGAYDETSRGHSGHVAVTVPVLTLLGASDEPATIDGYGPVDMATAQQLAAGDPTWIRVLTHPVTGTVIDVDRASYRPPADLRRLRERQQRECDAPGCRRPAADCDFDHIVEWQHGGGTSIDNGHLVCPAHHTMRHGTRWRVESRARPQWSGGPEVIWRSPTGAEYPAGDPPPF